MPKAQSKYHKTKMVEIMDEYTKNTDIPVLKELCYLQGWQYGTIQQSAQRHPKVKDAIERMLMKKEAVIEIGALKGELNSNQAKFSLGQLGWSSKKEVEITTKDIEDITPLMQLLTREGDD